MRSSGSSASFRDRAFGPAARGKRILRWYSCLSAEDALYMGREADREELDAPSVKDAGGTDCCAD